ncbi:MAG: DUF1501 domain-containing protein [Acidobacteria bacterium]|jgi:hypothetical protein|nr:DUF1501 domain-containing protein [Acidobacteriaceae bacterium]MCX6587936.1 DUF1501 domain-containing protein [Acidobacteriota bacterium]
MHSRRLFLTQSLGAIALNAMDALPHFAPKAKRVIFLTQSGGPSQLELFDHKPGLRKLAGQELPDSVRRGQRVTTMTANQKQLIMPGVTKFIRHGQSGAELGEWLPHLGKVVDDICFVKSMHTDQINHAPAMTQFLTGHQLPGRPTLGAWTSYGLGSVNKNLPDYLVLLSKMQRPSDQPLYDHYWGSGFLPSRYQGVKLRNAKDPVLYLRDPEGLPRPLRRQMLDGLAALNQRRLEETGDPEISTRIRQYEMAYRMQSSVPELTDLSKEPDEVFDLYGPDSRRPGSYAANCILARRLAERDVRFIQLFHPDWDHHSRLPSWCTARCRDTDQPSAALVTDLKRRGLLDDTLVVWGGEFGRGVAGQGQWDSIEAGRDHHPRCFTIWMAGAGVKPGISYGATDDFSFNVAENPVHVRDLHATILHLLGIDHTRFTFRFQGLDFRLTGVEPARVAKGILS